MKLTFLLFVLALTQGVSGQISGSFRTPAGQPVGYANVALLQMPDSAVVATTMTDSLGRYLLGRTVSGGYFIRSSSIGYQEWQSPVFQANGVRDLGVAVMVEDKRQLGAVVVQGRQRPVEQTIEGTVVHAESSILTKGSSILEVLQRSPGVQFDQHYNTITLNGKNGVTVMINGKMLQLPEDEVVSMLSSMPADNLDRLALLTRPS